MTENALEKSSPSIDYREERKNPSRLSNFLLFFASDERKVNIKRLEALLCELVGA